ncbi:MAG: hypothetical protein M3443_09500 [Actinomycetota bacterium]|nr:hypothetical protein [Actinomycetota bacterium]
MKLILGREPAVFFELLAGLLLAAVVLLPMPGPVTVGINATITAAAALATAAVLPELRDKVLPTLLAFVRALMAIVVGVGMALPEPTQAAIIGVISAVFALFVRQQVSAPLPPTRGLPFPASSDH